MMGIIIGGLVPAVLYGISITLQKAGTRAGIGMALLMMFVSAGVFLSSCAMYIAMPDKTVNVRSAFLSIMMGVCWALGTGAVAFAMVKFNVPVSKVVPLYNMNTLIAVLLGFLIFAEWKNVNIIQLLIGAILVVAGGTLVARA
jgi:uncharacterized membrane protein